MHKVILMTAASLGLAALLGGVALASDGEPSKPVSPPKPAVKVAEAPQPKTYVVASGDSLSSIAQNQQLPSWVPLWNANPSLNNPDLIYPGQQLVVPTGPTTSRPLPAGVVAAPVENSAPSVSYAPAATYQRPVRTANYASGIGGLFARIRARESGGNYAENTGNGYYGAYQFSLGTWESVGGSGLPSNASPAEQDALAQKLYNERGCSPWPETCY